MCKVQFSFTVGLEWCHISKYPSLTNFRGWGCSSGEKRVIFLHFTGLGDAVLRSNSFTKVEIFQKSDIEVCFSLCVWPMFMVKIFRALCTRRLDLSISLRSQNKILKTSSRWLSVGTSFARIGQKTCFFVCVAYYDWTNSKLVSCLSHDIYLSKNNEFF